MWFKDKGHHGHIQELLRAFGFGRLHKLVYILETRVFLQRKTKSFTGLTALLVFHWKENLLFPISSQSGAGEGVPLASGDRTVAE